MMVVLPSTTPDGRPLAEAEASTLERLKAEAREAGAKLEFVFADTLDGVEAALGPFAMREIVTPARALGARRRRLPRSRLLIAGWIALPHAPIELAWAPVDDGRGRRRAASRRRGELAAARPLRFGDRQAAIAGPVFRRAAPAAGGRRRDAGAAGERARRPALRQPAAPAAPVHRLGVARRRSGHPRRRTFPFAARRQRPDAMVDLMAAIPIEPVEDEVRLFVVATRDPGSK